MTVEGVKTAFDWVVVILAGLTFVSIAVVLITGNIINKRQAAQLRDFDQGLTTAKTELGKQQVRAANAERAAAEAKLELADFRAPRSIQDAQGFIDEMKAFSGQKFSCGVSDDQEASAFLLELVLDLAISGWKSIPPQISTIFSIEVTGTGGEPGAVYAGIGRGIGVYVEYAHKPSDGVILRARSLVSALEKHGIAAREGTSAAIAPDTLNIFVGDKPGRWKRPKIPAQSP